jgi:hypothetical protein
MSERLALVRPRDRRTSNNQDEIVTAPRKSIRIDCPDASRGARYEHRRFRIHGEF